MSRWVAKGQTIMSDGDPVPKVMGIVNATPDSFSDGAQAGSLETPVDRAHRLVREGADLLDLGGESSRPESEPVPLEEELRRVIPVVERLGPELTVPLSIDTTKAEVARQVLKRGASIINDITALRGDPQMAGVVAESGAGVVLMHMQGTPHDMQRDPRYGDVAAEVLEFLAERVEWCQRQGIPRDRMAVDPGIGFGKTFEHNLELLRKLDRFATLGCVLLVGTSRKRFLGTLTGRSLADRAIGSVVSSLASCRKGAKVVRVHDVGAMVDAIKVWTALQDWGTTA
jgi:dihydropteroate synthase